MNRAHATNYRPDLTDRAPGGKSITHESQAAGGAIFEHELDQARIANDLRVIASIDRMLQRSCWARPTNRSESIILIACYACLGATLLAFLFLGAK